MTLLDVRAGLYNALMEASFASGQAAKENEYLQFDDKANPLPGDFSKKCYEDGRAEGILMALELLDQLDGCMASKAEEIGVMDPQILEALDKLTPEELARCAKAAMGRKTES